MRFVTKLKKIDQSQYFIYWIQFSDWLFFFLEWVQISLKSLINTRIKELLYTVSNVLSKHWQYTNKTLWSELSEFNYLVTEYVHQHWQCFDFTEILEQQFHNCNNLYCCDFVLHTAHNSIALSTLKNIDTHSPVQLWWSTL
jgi:hypothetical protein